MIRYYAAALTPLKSDLSIDHKKLCAHCHGLLQRGVEGIALFGTTGEGNSFSVKERISALKKVINSGLPKEMLMMGNGSNGLGETVELAKAAIRAGCETLLIAPPCYFKGVEERGVVEFYRQILLKCPNIKLILYHIPQLSGVPITLNIIEALESEFPLFGLKESEGNLGFLKSAAKQFPNLKVFAGNELQIIEALKWGAAGTICGLANIAPELIASLFQLQENPNELVQLKRQMEKSFIPASKARLGWKEVRPPLILDKNSG
jgi:4-hydroxy-tetrahydrodipicolinate synthase